MVAGRGEGWDGNGGVQIGPGVDIDVVMTNDDVASDGIRKRWLERERGMSG